MNKINDENIDIHIREFWANTAPQLTEREKANMHAYFWVQARGQGNRFHIFARTFAVAMTLCLFFVIAYQNTSTKTSNHSQLIAAETNTPTYDQIVQTLSADDVVKTLSTTEQEQLIAILSDM